MKTIYVGIDVSKGYMDIAIVNDAGSVLPFEGCFDDTVKGHLEFQRLMESIVMKYAQAEIIFGVECSGGLERNWLHLIHTIYPGKKTYSLNPLAVMKFGERCLHRNITDQKSALNISNYLRLGLRPQDTTYEPQLEGAKSLYRHTRNEITRKASLENELHSLLVRTHPELVQYCRDGFPQWILKLLEQYPTASDLAKSTPESVSNIPYVNFKRAQKLINEASQSIASQTDKLTGLTIQSISRDILQREKQIKILQEELINFIGADEVVQLWCSFPGIGKWTAICLRLEFGAMERFYSAKAAVAFSGLDPIVQKSGDTEKNKGISRQGRRQIRGILYNPVLSSVRFNEVIHDVYARLRSGGKTHKQAMVACMRKTVCILYAMAITGRPFYAEYHNQLCKDWELKKTQKETETNLPGIGKKSDDIVDESTSLSAPITRREAKRRKEKISKNENQSSFKILHLSKNMRDSKLSHTGVNLSMRDLVATSQESYS